MSITLLGQILRLEVDAGKPGELFPVADRKTPLLYTASDVRIEIGLFKNDLWVDDASNIASLQIEVWRKSSGALLIDETTTDITTAPTEANWNAGTAQHAVFAIAADDTNFNLSGATAEPCHCEITALLTNGKTFPVAAADFHIYDTKHSTGDPTELPEPTYYTAAQVLTLLNLRQLRTPASAADNLKIYGSDGNLYQLGVQVVDGAKTFSLEQVAL